MVGRKSLKGDYCPSARSLDVIGDWWSLLIVRDAFDGLTRFSEFQKSLGIAKNILTERLRTLVSRGILEAVPVGDSGARMEYRLTAMGRDLFPVMVALRQFGERHGLDLDDQGPDNIVEQCDMVIVEGGGAIEKQAGDPAQGFCALFRRSVLDDIFQLGK